MNKETKLLLNSLAIIGIIATGYYGLKNKDPKLLGLAFAKLFVLGFII